MAQMSLTLIHVATSIIAARLGNCGPRGSHGDQVALNGTFNRAATFNIFYTFYWATQLTYRVFLLTGPTLKITSMEKSLSIRTGPTLKFTSMEKIPKIGTQ